MLGQKDNIISISYADYDDPQLFAQLCLAHINVLRAFDTISIYNAWLRRVDDVLGSNWCETDVLILKGILIIFIPLLLMHLTL